ncbi:serine protease snake-like [Wyeomyia smithii]|uniref:serine protease snake-like n=1 Tax=Wyeomyia smithii TaxID=174621 RepID=UPI002467F6A9|nr:serine protease snake-like [Wyeomyia smithii]
MIAYRFTIAVLSALCLAQSAATATTGRAERVANQKCQEFIDKNTHKSYGASLLLNPHVYEISAPNCSSSVDLIVNGVEAHPGEFPHQARLGYLSQDPAVAQQIVYQCGGSLISEQFVLTAAHCGKPKLVMLGEHNTLEPGNEIEFDVEAFIKHPKYRLGKSYHDIALVKLSGDVIFSSVIRPACLWTTTPLNLSMAIATGFGDTEFYGNSSTILMKVRLDVMSSSTCGTKFKLHGGFPDGVRREQLCVGSKHGNRDTCQGDSGGPLQTVTDVKTCAYHIVGITSLGTACGVGNTESVYTEVASYIDWIEESVWPEEYKKFKVEKASNSFPDYIIFFPKD